MKRLLLVADRDEPADVDPARVYSTTNKPSPRPAQVSATSDADGDVDRLVAFAGLALGVVGIAAAVAAPRPALIITDVVGPGGS